MFSSLSSVFRSLTRSPAATAIDQAHKMARRRIAAGGTATPARTDTKRPADFVLPIDADALAVARAVRRKLGMAEPVGDGADALHPLQRRKLGGRVVLGGRHLLRLGDGDFAKGRAFMHRTIGDVRAQQRRLRRCP
jgi:hypothetical protein